MHEGPSGLSADHVAFAEERFRKLQELIRDNKVLVEPSKTHTAAAFGGVLGGCLFTTIVLLTVAVIAVLLIRTRFLQAILVLVGLVVFWWLWEKTAFYYFYVRSLRDWKFFHRAYASRVIRLHLGEDGPVISHPTPWFIATHPDGDSGS